MNATAIRAQNMELVLTESETTHVNVNLDLPEWIVK